MIEYNPLFINLETWDFSYEVNSPCIDAGDPIDTDPDGSIVDIGSRWYSQDETLPGDCNFDNILNVLDIVHLVNICVLEEENWDCLECGDINQDGVVNILDVVIVVNFVLGDTIPDASEFSAADLNGDGMLNILDIVILTNLILGD